MWGRSVFGSEFLSISKKIASGICSSKYSLYPSLFVKGICQEQSIIFTLFKFENNGIGIVESSRVSTGNKNDLKYTLTGNQGALRFSNERNNEIQFYNNNEEESLKGFKKIEMGPFNDEFAKFHPVAGMGLGYQDYKLLECKQIIEAIALNKEAYPNFRWSAEIQQLVDAAIKSSKENRWIKIKELI